jgi:ATP-binding cassette, subfamily B, bacterial
MTTIKHDAKIPVWGETTPSMWGFLGPVLRPNIGGLAVIFLAQSFAALTQVMMPYALSNVVREIVASVKVAYLSWPMLFMHLLFFLFFAVADVLCTRYISSKQAVVGPKIRGFALLCLFNHLQFHSHKFISRSQAGALTGRMLESSTAVTDGMWLLMTEMWPACVVVLASSLMLMFIEPWLGIFVLVWAILFAIIAMFLAKQRHPMSKKTGAARARIAGALGDVVTNLLNIKLFAQERAEAARFKRVLEAEQREAVIYSLEAEKSRLILYFFGMVFKVSSLFIAVWMVASEGLSASDLVLSVFLANVVITYAHSSSKRMLELFDFVERLNGGITTILTPHEIKEKPGALTDISIKGEIEFKDVRFAYDSNREILKGLSVFIPAGQKVGLVGLSGVGKSSFVNLLLRLYESTSGEVLIDGVDIKNFSFTALYEQIALIPQDPILFHRSIRENIGYGSPEAAEEEVLEAARKGMSHDFIMSLSEKYETFVGERGIRLSGGQRQRIAISRALLKDAPIVILDEATSSLDSITESEIQDALGETMTGKTVIVVAHRLSTIRELDRILVFSDGNIIEDGSHNELLKLNGHYHDLWNRQVGGLMPD